VTSRSATEEDLANQPAVIIGLGGSSWPAAEKAGLVNCGGRWMTPEGVRKMRAWQAEQRKAES
jgi:hypothetical protein